MTLWFILSGMTVFAAALVVVPLLRSGKAPKPRAAFDVEIYADQLKEIDRDVARGNLDEADAATARAEIGRRLLAADAAEASASSDRPTSHRGARFAAAAIVVLAPLGAFALYAIEGSPEMRGHPASERAAERTRDAQMEGLIAELARRMKANPGDPRGWVVLGDSLASIKRYGEAANALERAVALLPKDSDLRSKYGEALVAAADGAVTPKARAAFEQTLALDPKEPRARYYLGIGDIQAGNLRDGLTRWRALEADSPADAPWLGELRSRIARLTQEIGNDAPAPRAEAAPPRGPTQSDIEAAKDISPGDREAMIRSMVASLAGRLEETPDDYDGWMRLGRSYRVLGEMTRSRGAYARAAELRPDAETLSVYVGSMIAEEHGAPSDALKSAVAALLKLDPKNRTGLWFAGETARRGGDPQAAREHWRTLLDTLEPGSPDHDRVKERIGSLGPPKP